MRRQLDERRDAADLDQPHRRVRGADGLQGAVPAGGGWARLRPLRHVVLGRAKPPRGPDPGSLVHLAVWEAVAATCPATLLARVVTIGSHQLFWKYFFKQTLWND